MKKLQKFLLNRKGVSTIEFALTIGLFLIVLFMIFEFGRITLLSAYWDLAITDSVRITKNQPADNGDYAKLFHDTLIKQHKKLVSPTVAGLFAVQNIDINVNVKYAKSVDDLINKRFIESNQGKNLAIAQYSLDYKYKFFIPLPFLDSLVNSMFKRKILMVQEYERSLFKY